MTFLIGILFGILVGILGLLALAVKLADEKGPEAPDTRIAATSVSMNGNTDNHRTLQDDLRLFREPTKGSA
jgi:hypothetical protein